MITTKIIPIRFNNEEWYRLNLLINKHKAISRSGFIKQLTFREIKPYLNNEELELLKVYILELNAVGRNLNQLLKYRAYNEANEAIEEIKNIIKKSERLL